ncbi:MAG: hypothetical protein ACLVEF_07265, partial [Bifidobacterium bifidum]
LRLIQFCFFLPAAPIAVIAVITLSIAMLCGCGTARNTNQATDSGSGGKRLASSLQAYATQLLGQDSGMGPAQKATLRKAATSGKISLSDYKAAWSRYITCVQDKGYPRPTLKTYSNGIQQPQGDVLPSDKADDLDYIQKKAKDLNACGIATVDSVDALYMAQVGNPNLYASHKEGAVDCLKRAERLVRNPACPNNTRRKRTQWVMPLPERPSTRRMT